MSIGASKEIESTGDQNQYQESNKSTVLYVQVIGTSYSAQALPRRSQPTLSPSRALLTTATEIKRAFGGRKDKN
jgi:hypothetical protein